MTIRMDGNHNWFKSVQNKLMDKKRKFLKQCLVGHVFLTNNTLLALAKKYVSILRKATLVLSLHHAKYLKCVCVSTEESNIVKVKQNLFYYKDTI